MRAADFLRVDNPAQSRRLAHVAASPLPTFHGGAKVALWGLRFALAVFLVHLTLWPDVYDTLLQKAWDWLLTQGWYVNQYHEAWYPLVFYPMCLAFFYTQAALLGPRFLVANATQERRVRQVENPLKIACGFVIYLVPPFALEWRKSPREDRLPAEAPSARRLFLETVVCMLIFDTIFFWAHLAMHRLRPVYRIVHKEHHRDRTTRPVDANWVHAAERLTLVLSAAFSLKVIDAHYLTRNVFTSWAVFFLVENHTGYDCPWMLSNVVPGDIVSGSRRHYLHHCHGDVFYGEYFTHWDNWLNRVRGWVSSAQPGKASPSLALGSGKGAAAGAARAARAGAAAAKSSNASKSSASDKNNVTHGSSKLQRAHGVGRREC